MTIEELLKENQDILIRMKNEEWDPKKIVEDLKKPLTTRPKHDIITTERGKEGNPYDARVR